jgi:hypothetical protein
MWEHFNTSLIERFHVNNISKMSLYNYLVRVKFSIYSSVPVASNPLQRLLAWHPWHDDGDDGDASSSQQQLWLRVWAGTWQLWCH